MYKQKLFCLAFLCLSLAHAQNWSLVSTPIFKPIRSMASFKGYLYATSDLNGIGCTIWSNTTANTCANLDNKYPNYSLYNYNNASLYIGRYSGMGVYKTNSAIPFNCTTTGLTLNQNTLCKTIVATPWAILTGTYGGQAGVYKLNTGTTSWVTDNNGLTGQQLNVNILDTMYHDVYAGTDAGVCMYHQGKWTTLDAANGNKNMRILSLKVTPTDLFVGTEKNGVYHATARSSSLNQTVWNQLVPLTTGLPAGSVNVLFMRRDSLYAGISTSAGKPLFVAAKPSSSVWANAVWTDFSKTLPIHSVFAMIVYAGKLYAGTEYGLYMNAW